MPLNAEPPQIPPHWGPVFAVMTMCQSVVMSECRFESVGNRLFLVGVNHQGSRMTSEPAVRQAIAWDSVTEVMSFVSLAEYAAWHNRRNEFSQSFDEDGSIPF